MNLWKRTRMHGLLIYIIQQLSLRALFACSHILGGALDAHCLARHYSHVIRQTAAKFAWIMSFISPIEGGGD